MLAAVLFGRQRIKIYHFSQNFQNCIEIRNWSPNSVHRLLHCALNALGPDRYFHQALVYSPADKRYKRQEVLTQACYTMRFESILKIYSRKYSHIKLSKLIGPIQSNKLKDSRRQNRILNQSSNELVH